MTDDRCPLCGGTVWNCINQDCDNCHLPLDLWQSIQALQDELRHLREVVASLETQRIREP